MTSSPYTKAYTENLASALERTRQELKDMIELLTVAYSPEQDQRIAAQMHRMVGSITDDLEG